MREGMKRITLYIITASVVLLIFFFTLSAPLVSTGADFSVYNSGWDGCSDLAVRTYSIGKFTPNMQLSNGREMDVVQKSITSYSMVPNSTSMVFLGPENDFTSSEVEYLDDFLTRGGTVVLADDFGSGNQLLQGLNTSSRFVGKPVLDLSFEKRPDFSVVYDIRDHQLTRNTSYLMLNRPTCLRPDRNATSLINTTEAAWIDSNDNGVLDEGESRGKFSVMSVEEYGDGELVLISDPSMLINSMLDKLDNRQFSSNLVQYISNGRSDIIFDESHRDMSIVYTIVYTGDYPAESISFLVLISALIVSVAVIVPGVKKKMFHLVELVLSRIFKEPEEESPLGKVLNNHPEWEEHKLKWIYQRLSQTIHDRED